MKSILLLFFFFVFSFSNVSAQTPDCQSFSSTIQILNTEQNYIDLDSNIIRLCVHDTLNLKGTGLYPNNDIAYQQSDMTSTFLWKIGSLDSISTPQLAYQFDDAGVYVITFSMTDTIGCLADASQKLIIQVEGAPNVMLTSESEIACPGQEVSFTATITDSTHYVLNDGRNEDVIFIPDFSGIGVAIPIIVDIFEEGQIMTSLTDLEYISINIEHSWMRDLEIKLISPNGQSIILHNHPENFGSGIYLGEPILSDDNSTPTSGIGYDYFWKFGTNLPTWLDWANNNNDVGNETLPSGEYAAFEGLDSLLGSSLNGEWILEITDLWAQDNGFIFSWGLSFDPTLPRINNNNVSFTSVVENAFWLEDTQTIEVNENTLVGFVSDSAFVYQVETEANCVFNYATMIETFAENAIECQACDSLFVDAGPDRAIACQNDFTSVRANSIGLSSYFEYTWTRLGENLILHDDSVIRITVPGTYVVQLVNILNGCTVTDTIVIEATMELPQVDAGTDIVSSCLEATILNATASQGANFSYNWTSLDSSIIVDSETLTPTVNASGTYVLTVINNETGCTSSDAIEVQLGLNLLNGFETQPTACDSMNGRATVLTHPTSDDIQFNWSTGESGSTIGNLAEGLYSVTVTNNTCNQSEHQNVYVGTDMACNATIAGRVILDGAGDCTADGIGVKHLMIHLMPIDLYTYTDQTGYFEFIVDIGTYTLEYIEEEQYDLLCPQNGLIDIDVSEYGVVYSDSNFWIKKAPVQNLCVSASNSPALPNFIQNYHLQVCNWGNLPQDATLTFQHDSIMDLLNLLDIADDYDPSTYTASWFFPVVPSNVCRSVFFNLKVPAGTPLGTILTHTVETPLPLATDVFPANNRRTWNQEVRGSYSLNGQQSFTGEHQFGGAIYENDYALDYQIRFQNVGTDTAFTVLIKDTLDAALDVRTIQAGQSSHDYNLKFEGNNVLVFSFKNILLPDNTTNESTNRGFVNFRINRQTNLPFGTSIQNTATIFFDYNAPIITNEVEHILTQTVAVEQAYSSPFEVFIAPNPAQEYTQIFYKIEQATDLSIKLYDIKGQLYQTWMEEEKHAKGQYKKSIDISDFPVGVYFIKFQIDNEVFVRQFIKQ